MATMIWDFFSYLMFPVPYQRLPLPCRPVSLSFTALFTLGIDRADAPRMGILTPPQT